MRNRELTPLELIDRRYSELGEKLDALPDFHSKDAFLIIKDIQVLIRLGNFFRGNLNANQRAEILASGEIMSQAKRNHPIFLYEDPIHPHVDQLKNDAIKQIMVNAFNAEHGNSRG